MERWVKYFLRGVQLEGVDEAAIRVTHLVLRSPTLCVLLRKPLMEAPQASGLKRGVVSAGCTRYSQGANWVTLVALQFFEQDAQNMRAGDGSLHVLVD